MAASSVLCCEVPTVLSFEKALHYPIWPPWTRLHACLRLLLARLLLRGRCEAAARRHCRGRPRRPLQCSVAGRVIRPSGPLQAAAPAPAAADGPDVSFSMVSVCAKRWAPAAVCRVVVQGRVSRLALASRDSPLATRLSGTWVGRRCGAATPPRQGGGLTHGTELQGYSFSHSVL